MSLAQGKANTREHCYLCDCSVDDVTVFGNMFEKRFTPTGKELNSMGSILSQILGHKLHGEQLHSTYLCSGCKMDLLQYETYQAKLLETCSNIRNRHTETLKLYEPKEGIEDVPSEMGTTDDDLIEECDEDADYMIEECSECSDNRNHSTEEYFDHDDDLIEEDSDSGDYQKNSTLEQPLKTRPDASPTPPIDAKQSKSKNCCSYCGQKFARRQWLEEHQRIHTGERPFQCELCNARFAQRSNWRTHMLTTHQNKANFKCNQCDRQFKRRRLLDNHIKSRHTKLRDLRCTQCDATFGNPVYLRQHMLCHTGEKRFSCLICDKRFGRIENRNIHHFVHSIRKPYACLVCGKEFMRKQHIQQHIATSMHHNPEIVRREPLFNVANSNKLRMHALAAANK
ncbi:zinc finger protein 510 [Drosophila grimshawi]|nr:zinc finger protein 510 [Drosophila grimshawi]